MLLKDLHGDTVANRLSEIDPEWVEKSDFMNVWIKPESLIDVCKFLMSDKDLVMDYLNAITAVDFIDHFDVIYQLTSTVTRKRIVVRSSLYGREELSIDSVTSLWSGANLQEREIWDLMGITFLGHPNMKRLLLWEGFEGHPLRKDFL
ncbi:MAG: NADH-quinone oxidoreductase subunit C [Dehalococcoidia bacterium]|tara:strand:- start:1726 stop:2169 length:444 start_codon:yes stop_codon:yes gene_type:complete